MRLITSADVAEVLTMRDAVIAMTAAFEQFGNGAGSIAPRVRAAAEHNQTVAAVATMGAALPAAGVVGAKVYSTIQGHFNFVIVLFSSVTGEALATIEANEITRCRTAAATAVAMQRLAAHDARSLAIFGTGVQARAHVEALLLVHPFERVRVAGRASAPEFANWIQTEFGVATSAVDAATAVRDADVIVTATRATRASVRWHFGQAGHFHRSGGLEQSCRART